MRRPLTIVALCALAGAALYLAATRVPAVRTADLRVFEGFLGLRALHGARYAPDFAGLFDPVPYALLVLGIAAAGVAKGRPREGLIATAMMVCASGSSELLKHLLAAGAPSAPLHGPYTASWPSVHSTSAMIFALALGIVVAPRWRPLAAAFGALLTIAIVYSLVILGSHYPSDVLGGLLMATAWRALAGIPLRAEPRLTVRAPVLAGAVFAAAVALAVAADPARAAAYAAEHTTFVAGALAIAAAALVLSGSGPAPRAAQSPPPRG